MQFLARTLPLARRQFAHQPASWSVCWPWLRGLISIAVLAGAVASVLSQEPQPAPSAPNPPAAPAQTTPAPEAAPPTPAEPPAQAEPALAQPADAHEVTEAELRDRLVGKQLFLRGGYLGESLAFNEHGLPIGHPAVGSYTLSGVEVEHVHLSKHKVELVGARYALHFLGALPNEDPSTAVERIKVTPKKKQLKITIDREQVVKEKKPKEPKDKPGVKKPALPPKPGAPAASEPATPSETEAAAPEANPEAAPEVKPETKPEAQSGAQSDAKAEPASEQAADPASVTTTTSQAHANAMLREALDRLFSLGLDDKAKAEMPDFWRLYYEAQAKGATYRPKDPNIYRSNAVDQQAKVTSSINPDSNEFAQASGIAGRALYRAVIGADGKPGEIAVLRPIGFGLDESAVNAIRKATFQPAVKSGQPVAETLDLAVLFRIYSKRTSVALTPEKAVQVAQPALPGPYTVLHPSQPEPPPATDPPKL